MNTQIEYIFQLEMEHRDLVAATEKQGLIIAMLSRALYEAQTELLNHNGTCHATTKINRILEEVHFQKPE